MLMQSDPMSIPNGFVVYPAYFMYPIGDVVLDWTT